MHITYLSRRYAASAMTPQPDLPEAAHHDLDSMLSRKFGKEVANYFAGSPLNRVSFLRTDNKFLSAAVKHSSAKFILAKELAPLSKDPQTLYLTNYAEVKPIIGEEPYGKDEKELISSYNSSKIIPQLIFLGLDERQKEDVFSWNIYSGQPYFVLDITPKGEYKEVAEKLIADKEAAGLTFMGGRSHMSLPAGMAAIYGQGRALLDWNARNPFCGGCGQPTLSINAGYKRTCPPTDWANVKGAVGSTTEAKPTERADCLTRKGVSNLCFPRTDPTVIMAVLNPEGDKVLLGRQKRWPPYWYSTLAGFVEPAESIEEAVRREVWEESGIKLGRVVIHSTQPWPFPANLMIGAIAQAIPGGDEILLKHDPELEDAKWVPLPEVRRALEVGTSGLDEGPSKDWKEGDLRLPPKTAIAHVLLDALTNEGFMGGVTKI